jgi:hypothetical protein
MAAPIMGSRPCFAHARRARHARHANHGRPIGRARPPMEERRQMLPADHRRVTRPPRNGRRRPCSHSSVSKSRVEHVEHVEHGTGPTPRGSGISRGSLALGLPGTVGPRGLDRRRSADPVRRSGRTEKWGDCPPQNHRRSWGGRRSAVGPRERTGPVPVADRWPASGDEEARGNHRPRAARKCAAISEASRARS